MATQDRETQIRANADYYGVSVEVAREAQYYVDQGMDAAEVIADILAANEAMGIS